MKERVIIERYPVEDGEHYVIVRNPGGSGKAKIQGRAGSGIQVESLRELVQLAWDAADKDTHIFTILRITCLFLRLDFGISPG